MILRLGLPHFAPFIHVYDYICVNVETALVQSWWPQPRYPKTNRLENALLLTCWLPIDSYSENITPQLSNNISQNCQLNRSSSDFCSKVAVYKLEHSVTQSNVDHINNLL